MAITAHAVHAGAGLEVLVVAIVDQGVEAVHRLDPDIAALAAVAAVGAAVLDEFFPAKRHSAAAAVSGADIDLALVEKFHGALMADAVKWGKVRASRRGPIGRSSA